MIVCNLHPHPTLTHTAITDMQTLQASILILAVETQTVGCALARFGLSSPCDKQPCAARVAHADQQATTARAQGTPLLVKIWKGTNHSTTKRQHPADSKQEDLHGH